MDDKNKNTINSEDSLEQPSTIVEPASTPDSSLQADKQKEIGKPASSEGESLDAQGSTAPSGNGADNKEANKPLLKRYKLLSNVYFLLFILLIILAGIGTAVAYQWSKSDNTPTVSNTSKTLTAQQLAALKGSTTVVGDSSQTLDVQSNGVFENQLLVRKDLTVAGTIKVGGSLSVPGITVSGASTFDQILVNSTLNVLGNTALQGNLNVQKNLTVNGSGSFNGTLSAAQLNVSTLQITGDLAVNRHITLGGTTPGKVNGAALGSGGTASVNGSDTAGTININTGGSPSAGALVTVNFVQKFNQTPHVVITPVGISAAGLSYYVNRTNTNFSVNTANAPPAGSSFSFDYIVID